MFKNILTHELNGPNAAKSGANTLLRHCKGNGLLKLMVIELHLLEWLLLHDNVQY